MKRFEVVDENTNRDSIGDAIDKILDEKSLPHELKKVSENLNFEKKLEQKPIPRGIGKVNVFGTTWDINAILKGNYWNRNIYTTDKLCKLFLKADLNQKKKYLAKKNPQRINIFFLLILMVGGIVALLVIAVLLPKLGVI